jgi:hypothetical protein
MMANGAGVVEVEPSVAARTPGALAQLAVPALAALVIVAIVLGAMVASSRSAWMLLGIGRGLVAPASYPVAAFLAVLATTLGQALGWAGGSALLYYVLTRANVPTGWATWRAAMGLVYLGLTGMPLILYHRLFGQPLAGLPQAGLEAWLRRQHPDAAWLLFTAHPIVDLSLIPLGLVFLGLLWGWCAQPPRHLAMRLILALTLLGSALAVALSLAIHSTLVHLHIAP